MENKTDTNNIEEKLHSKGREKAINLKNVQLKIKTQFGEVFCLVTVLKRTACLIEAIKQNVDCLENDL